MPGLKDSIDWARDPSEMIKPAPESATGDGGFPHEATDRAMIGSKVIHGRIGVPLDHQAYEISPGLAPVESLKVSVMARLLHRDSHPTRRRHHEV